ncbi:MAG: hypothetical protein AB7G65_19330 [Thermoleophilia bacterium]
MRFSYLGWCAAEGCHEEATKRVALTFGPLGTYLLPVCYDHLTCIEADMEALRGHALAVETERKA